MQENPYLTGELHQTLLRVYERTNLLFSSFFLQVRNQSGTNKSVSSVDSSQSGGSGHMCMYYKLYFPTDLLI